MLKLNELKDINMQIKYMGGEAGQLVKKSPVTCRAVLALPVFYDIGMTNINLRQMYYSINRRKDSCLERCFAVMDDMENLLREKQEKLYTLESKTPLDKCDIIFTEFMSTLMYTTFFNMLSLSNIPFKTSEREAGFPVIIATGNAVANPMPLSSLIDVFVIGDLYSVADRIVDKYVLWKKEGLPKQDFLRSLSFIDGVYVPSIHGKEKTVKMACVKDLNTQIVPKYQVTPTASSLADEIMIPLTGGCDRNCTMCQHKYMYKGITPKTIDKAVQDIKNSIEATGNTRINFVTNCYADYNGFPDIIYKIQDLEKPKIQNINFMEVKLNKDNLWLLKYLKESGKDEILPTIIVGSTNEKLRKILGIDITDEDVLDIARQVFKADFTKIHLKYVIGVPKETYEDLNGIFNLAEQITSIYYEEYSKLPEKYIVQIDVYGFSALPHTPMQYAATNNFSKLELKSKYINERNSNQYITINFENFAMREIEQIISRGDEKMSEAVYIASMMGANFDYIEGKFNYDTWQVAFSKAKIDCKAELEERKQEEKLPWDNIEVSTIKEELREKYLEIMKG
ncbi:MAG: hypothetical protein IKV94_05985 [Clostridia bacterium]|nr:hypothetical protein [Clostridia bacterium]